MQPPRPPRDPKHPSKPARAKSPSAIARDKRRAEQHATAKGEAPRPAREKTPQREPARRGEARARRPAAIREAAPERPGAPQRIAKLLARAGVASRREIERMIEERRIALDGVPIETPATILTSLRNITVDGKPIQPPAPTRLFRYHKPAGLLTAERDPKGRLTIYDRLPPGLPRVMPVGRLDLNTEGLLLLTTDGEFKRQLELPATGVERSYRARVFGPVSQQQLEDLIEGIEIEGVRYGPIDANLERRTGRNGWVEMRLREGKNREVRRVLEHLGLQVSRLIRTAYGPFALGDLPAGAVDEVRQHELVAFRKTLK
jgi:23S rRNA pseudouridine2605 synthase